MNTLAKLCVALAALGVGALLPATSAAENDATLLEVNNGIHGAPLAIGSKLRATANHFADSKEGVRFTDGSGNWLVGCTTNELTAELTKNTHTEVAANITAANFSGKLKVAPHSPDCSQSWGPTVFNFNPTTNGLPWCLQIKSVAATDTLTIRGGKCTEAPRPMRFTVYVEAKPLAFHCEYQRTEAITSTYTTGTTPIVRSSQTQFAGVTPSLGCYEKTLVDLELQLHRDAGELALVNAT